jgi:type I restriction enzyme S subunit
LEKTERAKRRGEYRYYGASGIIDYVDDYLFDGSFLLIAEDGANLVSRSTPIAFQAHGRFWVNNHAHVLRCVAGMPLTYLEAYLNSIDLRAWISGSAQPKLTQKAMRSIPIPVPPLKEQEAIAQLFDLVSKRVEVLSAFVVQASSSLKTLEAATLRQAFRGKLVAQDPNDEAASVFLERIRVEHAESTSAQPRHRRKQKTESCC